MDPALAERGKVRGQTSVEYLVLLAIAVLLSVAVIGVLGGFIKVGTTTTYTKKSAVYWKSTEIGIVDFQVYQTSPGRLSTIVFQNNKEYLVNLDWVSIDGGVTPYNIGKTLLPGDTYKWEGQAPFNCTSGGSYAYTVTIQYDNIEHGLNDKRFTGAEKLAGACSN